MSSETRSLIARVVPPTDRERLREKSVAKTNPMYRAASEKMMPRVENKLAERRLASSRQSTCA
jgi:hypothetical protein